MTSPKKLIAVKVEPAKVVIGPLGFHRFASEFLEAAKSVKPASEFSPVPYYLYCRTVELSLKAFLLTKSVSVKKAEEKFGA